MVLMCDSNGFAGTKPELAMETEEHTDAAEEMSNIDSQPTRLREEKFGLAEIRNEMSEISQILAYCYDKWWSRMDDRRLVGLDKSGVTISNERPFVIHNSALLNSSEVTVHSPTVSHNSREIPTVGFRGELAVVEGSSNNACVIERSSLAPPKPVALSRPTFTCYYCNRGRKSVTSLRVHIKKRHHRLYRCYDKWWRQTEDKQLDGLDKSGTTISNQMPFVVHNSADPPDKFPAVAESEMIPATPVAFNSGGIIVSSKSSDPLIADDCGGVIVETKSARTIAVNGGGIIVETKSSSAPTAADNRGIVIEAKSSTAPVAVNSGGIFVETKSSTAPVAVNVEGIFVETKSSTASIAVNNRGIIVETKSSNAPIAVNGGGMFETKSTSHPIAVNDRGIIVETKSSNASIAVNNRGITVETKSSNAPIAVNKRGIVLETNSSNAPTAVNGGGMFETKSTSRPIAVNNGGIIVETKASTAPIAVNGGGIAVGSKSSTPPIDVYGGGIVETKSATSHIAANNGGITVETKSSIAPIGVKGGGISHETKPTVPPIDVIIGGITVETKSAPPHITPNNREIGVKAKSTTPNAVNGKGIIVSIPIGSLDKSEISITNPTAILKKGAVFSDTVVPPHKKLASNISPGVAVNRTSVPHKGKIVAKPSGVNRPTFTCYYCNRTRRSVNSLRAHIKKHHHQLFRCVPMVVLAHIAVGKEDKKMNNFLNNRCTKRLTRNNSRQMVALDKSRMPISNELPFAVHNSADSLTVSRGKGETAVNTRTKILKDEGAAIDRCINPAVAVKKIATPPKEKTVPKPTVVSHPPVTCYYCNRNRKSTTSLKAHIKKRHHQLYRCYDESRRTNNNHLVGLDKPGATFSNKRPFEVFNTALAPSKTETGVDVPAAVTGEMKSATIPVVAIGRGITVETKSNTPPIAVNDRGIIVETESISPPIAANGGGIAVEAKSVTPIVDDRGIIVATGPISLPNAFNSGGIIIEAKSISPIAVNNGEIIVETESTIPSTAVNSGGIAKTKSTIPLIPVNDGGILVETESINPPTAVKSGRILRTKSNIRAIAVNDGGIVLETKSTTPSTAVNSGGILVETESINPPTAVKSGRILRTKSNIRAIAVNDGGIVVETKSTTPSTAVNSGGIVETKSTIPPIAVNDGGIIVETKSTKSPNAVKSGGIIKTKSTIPPIAVIDEGIVETKSATTPIAANGEVKSTVPPTAICGRGIIVSIPIVSLNNGDLKQGVLINNTAVPPNKILPPNISPVVAVKRISLPPSEKVIAKPAAVNRPMFTCYYCNYSKKSVGSLRAHIRKRHHQLFKAVPVVVLDRIEIGKEKKKMKNISNKCPSALGHCTYTECETWIPPGTSCQAVVPPAASALYHCADCNHSSHTREDMKVHIFTRHVYKRLCLDYSLRHASALSSKYFVKNPSDQEPVYNICKKDGGASGNMNTRKELDSQDYPAKSKYSRWYEEVKAELSGGGSRESAGLVCSCCRVAWLSLDHLHHHLSRLRRQLCLSSPLVRLERGYTRSGSHCVGSCCSRNGLGGVKDLYSCRCFYCGLRWPPLPGIDSNCIVAARHQLFKYFPVVSLKRIDVKEEIRKLGRISNPSHTGNPSNGECAGVKRRVYQCDECVYSVRSRKEMKVHIFTRHVYKKLWLAYTSRYPPRSSSSLSNVKLEPPSWPGGSGQPFSPDMNSHKPFIASTTDLGFWKCELIKDESCGDTDDDKMFACVYCEEDCETWQELKTHIAESHNELCSVTGFPDDFDMK